MIKQRFLALDVMRGLTLALMILVNTPGSWNFVYAPLLHADWHGATPTDYVFPFFLFIVGSAMYFSIRGLSTLTFTQQSKKIFRRGGLLFLIGVLLSAYPFINHGLHEWRIMGVLQRIALAYGFAAFIILYFGFSARVIICAVLLLGYWAVLLSVGADPYSLENNLVRQIDLAILGESHMWRGKGIPFDPEGILSTFPAIVNVLIGYEATRVLLSAENKPKAIAKLFGAAIVLVVLALIWSQFFPINKSIWTSSFVLLTSGMAIAVLILLIKLEQITQPAIQGAVKSIYHVFEVIGKNPLFIYILAALLAKTLYLIKIDGVSAYEALYELFKTFADPYFASFLFALLQVAILWLVAWILHKRNIVISL